MSCTKTQRFNWLLIQFNSRPSIAFESKFRIIFILCCAVLCALSLFCAVPFGFYKYLVIRSDRGLADLTLVCKQLFVALDTEWFLFAQNITISGQVEVAVETRQDVARRGNAARCTNTSRCTSADTSARNVERYNSGLWYPAATPRNIKRNRGCLHGFKWLYAASW